MAIILHQTLRRTLQGLVDRLLPGSCLLCTADSAGDLLCQA